MARRGSCGEIDLGFTEGGAFLHSFQNVETVIPQIEFSFVGFQEKLNRGSREGLNIDGCT